MKTDRNFLNNINNVAQTNLKTYKQNTNFSFDIKINLIIIVVIYDYLNTKLIF